MSQPSAKTTMPPPGTWARVRWMWDDLWPSLRLLLVIIGLAHVIAGIIQ